MSYDSSTLEEIRRRNFVNVHNITQGNIYTILTADVPTYINHHIQERKNAIYLNEYYTWGLSSPPRGQGIFYKEGIIRSSRSTVTPHHRLKSPAGNPSTHFLPSNESFIRSVIIGISCGRDFVMSALGFNFTVSLSLLFSDRSLQLLPIYRYNISTETNRHSLRSSSAFTNNRRQRLVSSPLLENPESQQMKRLGTCLNIESAQSSLRPIGWCKMQETEQIGRSNRSLRSINMNVRSASILTQKREPT